jgi:hypothetical protein
MELMRKKVVRDRFIENYCIDKFPVLPRWKYVALMILTMPAFIFNGIDEKKKSMAGPVHREIIVLHKESL